MNTDALKQAVDKLYAAGFKGRINRVIEWVSYPGGGYEYDSITLTANPNGTGEKLERYTTDLFIRYPEVTIQEATRIGLIDPKDAAPVVEDPQSPPALVDLRAFVVSGGIKYYASTAAGLPKPFGTRWVASGTLGNEYLKVAFPRVSFADPTEGWIQL